MLSWVGPCRDAHSAAGAGLGPPPKGGTGPVCLASVLTWKGRGRASAAQPRLRVSGEWTSSGRPQRQPGSACTPGASPSPLQLPEPLHLLVLLLHGSRQAPLVLGCELRAGLLRFLAL